MKKEEILKQIAPCSLMCHTCAAYEDGVICASSRQLLKYMDGMGEFFRKHAPHALDNHQNLENELKKYARDAELIEVVHVVFLVVIFRNVRNSTK